MDSELAQVRALVFEPYTLFRVRPMRGASVNVSEHGFRLGGKLDAWPPDPAVANVFVFGGSTAFGYGVADRDTIPSQLAVEIARLVPGKPPGVYNFATPNHSSIQERIRLEQLLVHGHPPRVAVFIDGFNEFVAPYYAPLMLKPFVDATAALSKTQRLGRAFGKVSGRLQRRFAGTDESACCLPDAGLVLDQYVANTRLIDAVCREFAIRPLFVWQPVPCYRYGGEHIHSPGHGRAERLIDCVRAGYEMMNARKGAHFAGERFLWLADMQENRTDNLYVDADHYGPGFSREIAARIAQHLVDCKLLG